MLSPIINLPPSFGSAYVGEIFSCALCANYDVPVSGDLSNNKKSIRDVRIEAEMKTPSSVGVVQLEFNPEIGDAMAKKASDLEPGQTLQRIVNFDLKEEGNHVLAVTVSYYEVTDISGRTRTFRKLYQFVCKPSLIVRTKASLLSSPSNTRRRWVLEAQLENCSEDAMQLDKVVLEPEPGLIHFDCNWELDGKHKPVLHPSEVEQVCFLVERTILKEEDDTSRQDDFKIPLGVLSIGWRGEMGNRGILSTGKLSTRYVKPSD
jgi:hypothetical protein